MLQGFAAVNKRLSSGGVLTGTLHNKLTVYIYVFKFLSSYMTYITNVTDGNPWDVAQKTIKTVSLFNFHFDQLFHV